MGFSLSWLAYKSDFEKMEMLEMLDLEETGDCEEFPIDIACFADLPSGWTLVCFEEFDNHVENESLILERLSSNGSAVMCRIEEHVMYAGISGWENGKSVWEVSHNAQQGADHLDVKGEPPEIFEKIRTRYMAARNKSRDSGVDYMFEIPVELGRALTYFRHDSKTPELDGVEYQLLW